MHSVTVACRDRGKEYGYRTMFTSTIGIAVCPSCGVSDGAVTPRGAQRSPLDVEGHDCSGPTDAAASRKGGTT